VESNWRPPRTTVLGKWGYAAFLAAASVVCISLLVPVSVLAVWSVRTFLDPHTFSSVIRTGTQGFGSYIWNSLWSSALAAFFAVVLSLPVALFTVRSPNPVSRFISRFCHVGYAIPGVVIALSLLFIINRALPFLYATPLVVVIAYVLGTCSGGAE
jgi:iron(III) transport system permease protein